MTSRSDGLRQFEKGLDELEERVDRGEFTDSNNFGQELYRLLETTLPRMTAYERDAIEKQLLTTHYINAKILAEQGTPVPGNDPRRPN